MGFGDFYGMQNGIFFRVITNQTSMLIYMVITCDSMGVHGI